MIGDEISFLPVVSELDTIKPIISEESRHLLWIVYLLLT